MVGSARGVSIRAIDEWPQSRLRQISELFQQKLLEEPLWEGRWNISQEYFSWKLRDNPTGPAVGAFAEADGQLVGAVTIVPNRITDGAAPRAVGELGNIYVAQSHRGKGIFERLLLQAIECSVKMGMEMIFCLPNASGAAALVKTGHFQIVPEAGFATWLLPLQPVTMLAARLKFLRPAARADKLIGRMLAPERWNREISFERTSPDFIGHYDSRDEPCTRFLWPQDHLTYRTLRYPALSPFEAVAVRNSDGCLMNTIIFTTARLHGVEGLFLIRVENSEQKAFSAALKAGGLIARQQGCAFAALWAPRTPQFRASLLRNGYLPAQRKPFAVAKDCPGQALDLSRLRIDMLDSDKI